MFLINTNTVGESEDSDLALELAYREMAEDTEAEAEALEWSEALIGDSLFSLGEGDYTKEPVGWGDEGTPT